MWHRLRLRFRRGEELKFISHLDMMRLWERVLRRADIPLAYSEGFTPHPRLALAVPLPVGVTSEAELMDIILTRPVSHQALIQAVSRQLPPGVEIIEARAVPLSLPSLQSQIHYAEYEVELGGGWERQKVERAIEAFLAAREVSWQHQRDREVRRYNLRALVDDLWLTHWQEGKIGLGMRVRCDSSGTGRPEQVTAALGFRESPSRCHRTRLLLEKTGARI
jgi:radical SAM-linked protein